MRKKSILITVTALLLGLLLGCNDNKEFDNASSLANEYYDSNNYQEVVDCLKDYDLAEYPDLKKIYDISSAHITFNESNYVETLKLLEDYQPISAAEEHIYNISKGMEYYNAKDYELAIEILSVQDLNSEQLEVLNDAIKNKYLEHLPEVLKTNDADKIEEYIREYSSEVEETELLDNLVKEYIEPFYVSDIYEDYVWADKLKESLSDLENMNILEDVIANEDKKYDAFLNNIWFRRDGTFLSGMEIECKSTEGKGIGIVTSVSNTINNKYKFAVSDIKWGDMQKIDSNRFSMTEMAKNNGIPSYIPALGEINYDSNLIYTHSSEQLKSYSRGTNQVWIRGNFYELYKDVSGITEEDFVVDEQTDSGIVEINCINELKRKQSKLLFFDNQKYESKEEVILKNKGVGIGSTFEEIVSTYGFGVYKKYDNISDTSLLKKVKTLECESALALESDVELIASYDYEKKGEIIFYFLKDSTVGFIELIRK